MMDFFRKGQKCSRESFADLFFQNFFKEATVKGGFFYLIRLRPGLDPAAIVLRTFCLLLLAIGGSLFPP